MRELQNTETTHFLPSPNSWPNPWISRCSIALQLLKSLTCCRHSRQKNRSKLLRDPLRNVKVITKDETVSRNNENEDWQQDRSFESEHGAWTSLPPPPWPWRTLQKSKSRCSSHADQWKSTDVCSKFKPFQLLSGTIAQITTHGWKQPAKGITTLCVVNPVSVRLKLARRQNTWQKQSKCETAKEMIETNTWQKPSACDTPSRSKRETTVCKRTLFLRYTHVSVHFVSDALTVLHPPLGPRKRSLKICGSVFKCIGRHASRPYAMCLDSRGFLRKA